MIALDSSVLVAIILHEPERDQYHSIIKSASKALISLVSVVETKIVLHARRGHRAVVQAENLFKLPMLEITPPTFEDMNAAAAAFVAYGKGSRHPANLNFGDLFSYALAKTRNLPLLFKGDDFSQTDIQSAIP